MTKALVLAGTESGCGKTSVTLGLLAALTRRGLNVQPFKAGPDFIDPGLHQAACGRESHNLDTWMLPEEAVRGIFARHARGVDLALVEGAMGLYDGAFDPEAAALAPSEPGSCAHLAKMLGLPVLLVADARAKARSAAALVQGYIHFDPELSFAGVVLNRTGSERHAAMLRQGLRLVPQARLLGCLPRFEDAKGPLRLPARHLGLVTAQDLDQDGLAATLAGLADWVEAHLDLDALLAELPEVELTETDSAQELQNAPVRARLGLARDSAFCFLYAENLRLLRVSGAEIVPFSPLADAALPEGLDGLLLPGGYPEMHAEALAANSSMRQSMRAFCASGRPVWAECGGYMYLGQALTDAEGREWPMCGALPVRARMGGTRAALGYREARVLEDGPLGPAGTLLRGHEFHYSRMDPLGDGPESAQAQGGTPCFLLTGGENKVLAGLRLGSVLASYFHVHLGSCPQAAIHFVDACARR